MFPSAIVVEVDGLAFDTFIWVGTDFRFAYFNPRKHGGHREAEILLCAVVIVLLGRERRFAFPIHTTILVVGLSGQWLRLRSDLGYCKDCAGLVVPIPVYTDFVSCNANAKDSPIVS